MPPFRRPARPDGALVLPPPGGLRGRSPRSNAGPSRPCVRCDIGLPKYAHRRCLPSRTPSLPPSCSLVRHGVTPTTGKILPGRAAGTASQRRRAEAGGERRRNGSRRCSAWRRSTRRRSSGRARRRCAIARARRMPIRIERGLLELDIGEWTGREARRAAQAPEWDVVQRHPSAFRFPGGESFTEMQARITRRARAAGRAASRARGRRRLARRPDQGGRRARARRAPRSLPAHRDRHRVDHRHRVRTDERDRAHRELESTATSPRVLG